LVRYLKESDMSIASTAFSATNTHMHVEKLKYTIWAADAARAANFYHICFGAIIVRQNPHITEIEVAGSLIAIHSGGEGKRTWTGLTFQVADVVVGAAEIVAAGGICEREPQPENGEAPHLAMCEDTDGNQIMLSRAR
jgi:predicted enzyme related to lactoylglutathione lyase